MLAIKATFDGRKVILPDGMVGATPGDVVVLFGALDPDQQEGLLWMKLQEEAFAKVWDNDEDAIYDKM